MDNLQETQGFMAFLAPSETLAIAAKAKALKAAGEKVCGMAAGEPDFDTPAHIKKAAIEALEKGETKYTPASGILELKKAIAEKLVKENGVASTAEQVVVAPGAKFSGFTAVCALCGPGDEVIIPSPYWVSYPEMVKAAGAKSVIVPCAAENNFELVPAELEKAITPRTKLLILNSPSNPTGAVYRRKTLEAIAEIAIRRKIMVLSDEIYEKLVYDAEFPHVSIASFSKEINELTITVNGFSKAYAMPGWRLGYLSAPKWLSSRIVALQSHTTSNPTSFVQFGGLAAIAGDQAPVEAMRKEFAKRRDVIHAKLSAIPGIKTIRPSGAFYVFCDISSSGLDSTTFINKLLDDEKVAGVPGKAFGDDRCIRLSYACSMAMVEDACARIARFRAGLKG